MTLKNLGEIVQKATEDIENLKFKDVFLPSDFKEKYSRLLNKVSPDGYKSVIWADHSAKIITATDKIIYLPNYWFYLASRLASLLESFFEHKEKFIKIFSNQEISLISIAKSLKDNDLEAEKHRAEIAAYFKKENLLDFELRNFEEFVCDYSSWGGGKTVDRSDFFISALMKAGRLLAETSTGIAEIASHLASNPIIWNSLRDWIEKENESKISTYLLFDPSKVIILSKPFILLAGISGTGKTRFVKKQADLFLMSDQFNYSLISVRPDWHDPSDLLGYISRLGAGGAEYIATDLLKFIVKAWLECAIECSLANHKPAEQVRPFWLCLDEMNLAPVEQYFADYLSVLETRKWDEGKYTCDPLLKPAVFDQLDTAALEKLRSDLGLQEEKYAGIWNHFKTNGIAIPFNLIVAGTVNMDETTHGFSRKVIDRALTFDFGTFFPNDFREFFAQESHPKILGFPILSHATTADMKNVPADPDGLHTIEFMQSINGILRDTPFELAYRALNELLLTVISHAPADEATLQAVWDDFLMCKVLPRIDGDEDKLRSRDATTGNSLLENLSACMKNQLERIWENQREDLFRESVSGEKLYIQCRSKAKLEWMQQRLTAGGFTSFWP